MDNGRGIFIVIEGTDGSGKGTQFQLLKERLMADGYDVATFDFPQYDQPSSHFVRQYLNGHYGTLEEVGPYTSSLFYALDRYEAAPRIRQALQEGKVVIANRFTGSNMAHQGTKFQNAEERRGYFIWLDNLEFEMLRIPRPDMSFVLRVPADIAQGLVDQKTKREYTDRKRDLHEADLEHLKRAVAVYDDLTELFPKDFQRIDCVRDDQLMSVETVQGLIWQKVEPLLPEKPAKTQPAAATNAATTAATPTPAQGQKREDGTYQYYIPASLTPEARETYTTGLNRILDHYSDIGNKLTTYLTENSTVAKEARDEAWQNALLAQVGGAIRPILPVAIMPLEGGAIDRATTSAKLTSLANEFLPGNHADQTKPLELLDVFPRNEIDLLPDMLYEYSSLPLHELRKAVQTWPYDRKLAVFEAYLGEALDRTDMPTGALEKIQYSWDMLSDFDTFRELQPSHQVADLEWQPLTPRYGFEVPKLIEEAGLADEFEECFDMSLALYSQLQEAGHSVEAQYTTLLGHKLRWKVTCNARQAFHLYETRRSSAQHHHGLRQLVHAMHQRLSEVHPMLGEAMQFVDGDKTPKA